MTVLAPGLPEPVKARVGSGEFEAVGESYERIGVGTMMDAIRAAAGKLLEDAKLFDIYRGEKLGSERKSVAFAITLRAADRTLTDEEINAVMEKVLKALNTQFGAELRG